MIKINLLPAEAGGKRAAGAKAGQKGASGGSSFPLYALLLALFMGGVGYYGYTVYDSHDQALKSLEADKTKKKKKEDEVKKKEKVFREQFREMQEIEAKFAVVQALNPPNRLFWSEKVNMLALAQSKAAVYVTRMKLDERVEEVETEESKKRRADWEVKNKAPGGTQDPMPKTIKTPIIYQTLNVEAIAYGVNSAQQTQQISLFNTVLTGMDWTRHDGKKVKFTDGLNPEFRLGNQIVTKVGGIDVLRFSFIMDALPQRDTSQDKPAEAPGTEAKKP